jgi:hypothetical protein
VDVEYRLLLIFSINLGSLNAISNNCISLTAGLCPVAYPLNLFL